MRDFSNSSPAVRLRFKERESIPEKAAPKHFTLDIEVRGNMTIVRCHGQLVSGLTDILYSKVRPMIPETKRIVLDLCDVHFMDSMGLGTLVCLYTSAQASGCELQLLKIGQARQRTPRHHQSPGRLLHHRRTRRQALQISTRAANASSRYPAPASPARSEPAPPESAHSPAAAAPSRTRTPDDSPSAPSSDRKRLLRRIRKLKQLQIPVAIAPFSASSSRLITFFQ